MMIMNEEDTSLEKKRRIRDYLSGFVTERRSKLFGQIVSDRTRYLTIVLENLYQPHNASAVLRSCDCFGIQDVHIIENSNTCEINPEIELGSAQWLTIKRYADEPDNTALCLDQLKEKGYRIVATTPRPEAKLLQDFDLQKGKFALLFGTEKFGLSETALELSDEFVRIPMYGFTESFNISVSAALCMFHFSSALRREQINWKLREEEIIDDELHWLRSSIKESAWIEKQFHEKK